MPPNTKSAIDAYELENCRVVVTTSGAPGGIGIILDEEPMCMQITVPVSAQAEKKGSQLPS
jgi:hypothetical protein